MHKKDVQALLLVYKHYYYHYRIYQTNRAAAGRWVGDDIPPGYAALCQNVCPKQGLPKSRLLDTPAQGSYSYSPRIREDLFLEARMFNEAKGRASIWQ